MTADLAAAHEVPPNPSTAGGSATLTFETTTRRLSWSVAFRGLTDPLSMAHFHGPAPTTGNAAVVVPIAGANAPSPVSGSAVLTEAQAADLLAGRWYINLHTPAYPGGEIRGQVVRR